MKPLRITHFAPFAPSRAGIYEAARDMSMADALQGHDVRFVDAGTSSDHVNRNPPVIGGKDERGAFALVTEDPLSKDIQDTDVIVAHTGVPDHWVVRNQAPMVWVIHGRPAACFRSEMANESVISYRLVRAVAEWKRSKALVHFWPEFSPYWEPYIPEDKRVVFDFPPIDGERFSNLGPLYMVEPHHRGKWNGLICDSWRDDIDIFEITNGAVAAAKAVPDLKWHFYAVDHVDGKLKPCWDALLETLKSMGALGAVSARVSDMGAVYRAHDFVLTPHKIVTRIIGESLSCGTPVVASHGCKVTPYRCAPSEPGSVAEAVARCVHDLKARPKAIQGDCLKTADAFSLLTFGEKMTKVYDKALGRQAPHESNGLSCLGDRYAPGFAHV